MNRLKEQINYAKFAESSIVALDIDYAERLLLELTEQYESPTLEEVKKEWEEKGYEWCCSNGNKHLVLVKNIKNDKYNGDYTKVININFITKTYSCYIDDNCSYDEITFEEHQLLTKTFKALEWM